MDGGATGIVKETACVRGIGTDKGHDHMTRVGEGHTRAQGLLVTRQS